MQAIGMFYQQAAQNNPFQEKGYKNNSSPNEKLTLFEGLLGIAEKTLDNSNAKVSADILQGDQGKLEQLLTILMVNDIKRMLDELLLEGSSQNENELALFIGSLSLEEIQNDEDIVKELLISLQDNKEQYKLNEFLEALQSKEGQNMLKELLETLQSNENSLFSHQSIHPNSVISQPEIIEGKSGKQQLNQLLTQVEAILAKINNNKDVIKEAPKLLKLLKEWTTLQNKVTVEGNQSADEVESKEHRLWKELLNSFQRRNQFAVKHRYNIDANVTSKDVEKWINNGLVQQVRLDSMIESQHVHSNSSPITNLEQYVIHINQTSGSQQVDKQLIAQFESIMKSNRFLTMNNGTTQLSISLRPDNLGEMSIRLTQINGEMTLKIIVSSQATRQMLEANIHQLKNMFSPNQVIIEEQEVDGRNIKEEHKDETMADQDEGHSHQSSDGETHDEDGDFETMFQEVILNEKV